MIFYFPILIFGTSLIQALIHTVVKRVVIIYDDNISAIEPYKNRGR